MLITQVKKILPAGVNYQNPLESFKIIIDYLKINYGFYEVLIAYSANKANNYSWINGVCNILYLNRAAFLKIRFNWQNKTFYNYQQLIDILEQLETIQPDPEPEPDIINPATGQPWGFGSYDYNTGEIIVDGKIVRPASGEMLTINPKPQPQTDIDTKRIDQSFFLAAVIVGAVILKRKK